MKIKEYIKNFIHNWKTRQHNRRLVKRYPFLKMDLMPKNELTWLDYIPDGWKKISLVYFETIRTILIQNNALNLLKFSDVKEKYGSLRIYTYYEYSERDGIELNKIYDKIDKLISNLEHDTWRLCIYCGKPAAYSTKGWILPVCKFCKENDEQVFPNIEFEDWKDWDNG